MLCVGGDMLISPQVDIWAQVCQNMATELGCTWDQILLSHRTMTMDAFHTLGEAGITVGDIVGEADWFCVH